MFYETMRELVYVFCEEEQSQGRSSGKHDGYLPTDCLT